MAVRFFRRGFSKIYFLSSIASASAGTGFTSVSPTSGEMAAGWDLSLTIQGITGFALTNTPIEVPDLSSRFNKTISGQDTTPASSLDFYDEDAAATTSTPTPGALHSQDVRFLLAKGTVGYIVLLPYGNVSGRRLEVWSVQTLGVNDQWSLTAEAGRFTVPFAVLDVPNQLGKLP